MKSVDKHIQTNLLNCFGFEQSHQLTINQALSLLKTAKNPWVTLYFNVKKPQNIESINDFSIGYSGLTANDFLSANPELLNNILLTTDKAEDVDEAVQMALLSNSDYFSGKNLKIKLEVLSHDFRHPINDQVIEASKELLKRIPSGKVWPIINYQEEDFYKLKKLGVKVVRVIRGPIGCNGAEKDIPDVKELGKIGLDLNLSIILEGGIGKELQVYEALRCPGINAVLVNSCLFQSTYENTAANPLFMIKKMKHAADLASNNSPFVPYEATLPQVNNRESA